MTPILALAFGYLLGSIPFGVLVTRLMGLGDLRSIGSGNIGATNVLRTGNMHGEATVPFAAMLTCGVALIVGLWFIGRKVIATVGTNLTEIHPASGFAAELAAAGIVMAASVSGLPVSSTHILIGAIIGVGLVNRSANWKLMKPIALAWIITRRAMNRGSSPAALIRAR